MLPQRAPRLRGRARPTRPTTAPPAARRSTMAALLDRCVVASCSPMFRRETIAPLPPWYFDCPWGDWPLYFLAAAARRDALPARRDGRLPHPQRRDVQRACPDSRRSSGAPTSTRGSRCRRSTSRHAAASSPRPGSSGRSSTTGWGNVRPRCAASRGRRACRRSASRGPCATGGAIGREPAGAVRGDARLRGRARS